MVVNITTLYISPSQAFKYKHVPYKFETSTLVLCQIYINKGQTNCFTSIIICFHTFKRFLCELIFLHCSPLYITHVSFNFLSSVPWLTMSWCTMESKHKTVIKQEHYYSFPCLLSIQYSMKTTTKIQYVFFLFLWLSLHLLCFSYICFCYYIQTETEHWKG